MHATDKSLCSIADKMGRLDRKRQSAAQNPWAKGDPVYVLWEDEWVPASVAEVVRVGLRLVFEDGSRMVTEHGDFAECLRKDNRAEEYSSSSDSRDCPNSYELSFGEGRTVAYDDFQEGEEKHVSKKNI